jgi:nucleotide-binding universal stress UspA family protein
MKTDASSSLQLLLPLDGSPLAEQVVPVVQGLASCLPVTVRLLHVVAPGLVRQLVLDDKALFAAAGEPDSYSADETTQVQDILLTESRRYLEQLAHRLADTTSALAIAVPYDVPAEAIVRDAITSRSDLIIMTSHGEGGLRRWGLGSVTARVLHLAERPVLVVRGSALSPVTPFLPRRIMVALDGSPAAERSLPLATHLAYAAGADMALVQVVEPGGGTFGPPRSMSAIGQLRERALGYLRQVAGQLRHNGSLQVTTTVAVGHVAETLVDEAERQGSDLAVLARHGHARERPLFMGSTAEKVCQVIGVPLLVVA